jgi:hypothetical protein
VRQTTPLADKPANKDKGERAACLGSIIKTARLLDLLPADGPKVPAKENVDVLLKMVAESSQMTVKRLTAVSTVDLQAARDYWRAKRPEDLPL